LKKQKTKEAGHWANLRRHYLGKASDFISFVQGLIRYQHLPAADAAKQVLSALKVVDYYEESEYEPDNNPVENIAELLKVANRFGSVKEFADYARKISAASKSKTGVALGTCHAAKGLEFERVFLVECNDGLFPHIKAEDSQSERNVFFVGCSRAERELTITYSGRPSPFLGEESETQSETAAEQGGKAVAECLR
jgi:superfamily I DNA/RNA helicase